MSAYAQWFEAIGRCVGCAKPATGWLRGFYGNSNLGSYCKPCADKAIKAAHRKGGFEPDAVAKERALAKAAASVTQRGEG